MYRHIPPCLAADVPVVARGVGLGLCSVWRPHPRSLCLRYRSFLVWSCPGSNPQPRARTDANLPRVCLVRLLAKGCKALSQDQPLILNARKQSVIMQGNRGCRVQNPSLQLLIIAQDYPKNLLGRYLMRRGRCSGVTGWVVFGDAELVDPPDMQNNILPSPYFLVMNVCRILYHGKFILLFMTLYAQCQ